MVTYRTSKNRYLALEDQQLFYWLINNCSIGSSTEQLDSIFCLKAPLELFAALIFQQILSFWAVYLDNEKEPIFKVDWYYSAKWQ